MSSNYSHVRGDTFSVLHLRQQKDGTARDLTGYQIHAELQHRAGQLVEVLTVTVLDQASHAGEFVLSVPDTAAWPLARLRYKIRFTDPQGVITTSGFIDLRVAESYPADCCADEPTVQVSVSPEISIVEADPDQLFVQVGTVISIAGSGGGITLPIAQSAVSGLIPRLDAADAELATTKTLAQVNQLNIGLKADHTELETTNAQVESNRLAILTKADLTALSALALLVSSKADASAVAQQIADLLGTDAQVLAAIQTLGAALAEDQDLLDALEYTVANRVRFDTATQALTALQKANARTNISAEELGTAALLIAQITAASLGAATAAQGAKADTALQSADVAPVALSGNYNDLSNLPVTSAAQKYPHGVWSNQHVAYVSTSATYNNTSYFMLVTMPQAITVIALGLAFTAAVAGRLARIRFYTEAGIAVTGVYQFDAAAANATYTLPASLVLPAGRYLIGVVQSGTNTLSNLRNIQPSLCEPLPAANVATPSLSNASSTTGYQLNEVFANSLVADMSGSLAFLTQIGTQPAVFMLIA